MTTAIRAAICANLDQLGIDLGCGAERRGPGPGGRHQRRDSRVKIMVIPTNEELVVAREVKRLLETNYLETLSDNRLTINRNHIKLCHIKQLD